MWSFEVPLDPVPGADIEAALRRELQTLDVTRVEWAPGRVRVEAATLDPPLSTVLAAGRSGSVAVEEVRHHAAVLPRFLSMFRGGPPVYVIHVDSHDDLGSPNLLPGTAGCLVDRWTGRAVTPQDPAAVRSAIDSSAVEIGSYLTLALHWLPVVGMAFVFPEGSLANIAGARNPGSVSVGWAGEDVLDRAARRLRCRPSDDGEGGVPVIRCDGHGDLAGLGRAVPGNARILLDIDCDYFDDAAETGSRPRDAASMDVEGFLGQVLAAAPRDRLNLVCLSHSPGFCPRASAEAIRSKVLCALGATAP